MKIRKITEKELKYIINNLEKYDDFWTKEMYISEYNNINSKFYVLDDLSGFFIIQNGLDESFLMNIVVDKSLRDRGLGKILIEKFIQVAKNKRILLEVSEKNEIALKLYKAYGFNEISRRKNYYKGQSAIIMEYIKD